MSKRTVSTARLERQRAGVLKRLRKLGPVVIGSLVAVKSKTCDHTAHLLTFKDEGKTKSVYVPLEMVKEVEEWVSNNRKMRDLARRISDLSVGMIRRHASETRAEERRRRRPMKSPPPAARGTA